MARCFKIDGRQYPVPDYETITFEEGHFIKSATGLRMGELEEELEKGDTDAILSLFLVAKRRVDGPFDVNAFLRMPVLSLELGDDGASEVPLDNRAARRAKPKPKPRAKPKPRGKPKS